MRSLINIVLASIMALTACDQNPLGLGATKTESFEEFVAGLEHDATTGVPIDWTQAERRYAEYTASLPTSSTELTEAEQLKHDELVGRWWAARVENMTFKEACAYLKSKGRQAEAFIEELQQ